MFRTIFFIFVSIFSISCFGQASLAAYSGEKLVGWLMSPADYYSNYYLTPAGDIMLLKNNILGDQEDGELIDSVSVLVFTDSNCEGTPFAYTGFGGGRIIRHGVSTWPDARFFVVEYGAEQVYLSNYYNLNSEGCYLENRYTNPFFPVTLLNADDIGFQYVDGRWKILIDSRVLERPDPVICHGKKNCPQ